MTAPPITEPTIKVDMQDFGGRFGATQILAIAFAALAIMADGIDNLILGFAIPVMAKEWGITPSDFAPSVAASLIGMAAGTITGGLLGDTRGRKLVLTASVAIFGVFTLLAAFSSSIFELTVLRFIAGIGMGSALPSATAVAAEFSPVRFRPLTVSLTIVCVPIGGLIGSVYASWILPKSGWDLLFLVSGGFSLVLALAVGLWLPESPSFLARRPSAISKSANGISDNIGTIPLLAESAGWRASLGRLFAAGLAKDTVAICAGFFFCLTAIYGVLYWMPSTLTAQGFDARISSLGMAGFNFGGILGALGAAALIIRFGSRLVMIPLCIVGAILIGVMGVVSLTAMGPAMLITLMTALGVAVQGVQVSLFPLAAGIFPTEIRSSGVGLALAFGRVGGIASSFAGAAVLTSGGASFFVLLFATLVGTCIALALIRRHIPSSRAEADDPQS